MIIIEGPDLVGKTRLCMELLKVAEDREIGPLIYGHFRRLPSQWDYCRDYFPYIAPTVCMDRFHLSELAYGPINCGRSRITPMRLQLIESQLAQVGAVVVVITAHPALIKGRFVAAREMFTCDQVLEVNRTFGNMDEPRIDIRRHYGEHDEVTYPSSDGNLIDEILTTWTTRRAEIAEVLS